MDDVLWTPENIGNTNDLLTYHELELIYKMNGQPNGSGHKTIPIRGYITLKYEGAGTELTSQQLTNIRTWFGDTVFTKGSSGLVVDYMHNYIQINVGGQVTIENGEIYLREGDRAMLSATQFLLDETVNNDYIWGLSEPNSVQTFQQIGGVYILNAENTIDHNTYLVSSESVGGVDYDIVVKVTAGGNVYSSTIHIIAAKYPSSIGLGYSRYGNVEPRYTLNTIILWQNGISCNLFATAESAYTATIRSIVYTITAPNDRTGTYSSITGPSWPGETFNIDDRVNLQENTELLGMGNTPCIRVNCPNGVPNNSDTYEYTIGVLVTFNSDKQMSSTGKFIIMNDSTPIITRLLEYLYEGISNRWQTLFGEELTKTNLYRADLFGLTGSLTFGPNNNLNNIVTNKGTDSLLDYLPSITGLVFDNNINLTSTFLTVTTNNGNMFVFDKMPQLQSLSILNCTNLTEDIDLTMCDDLTEVDASGTNVSVFIPTDSKITKYELGTPSEISIVNPTVLTISGCKVDSYAKLDQLVLENIPNSKAYALFDKIIDTYIIGGTMYWGIFYGSNEATEPDTCTLVEGPYKYYTTSKIPVISGHSITVVAEGCDTGIYPFNTDGTRNNNTTSTNNGSSTITIGLNIDCITLSNGNRKALVTRLCVTDNTSDKILFEWRI